MSGQCTHNHPLDDANREAAEACGCGACSCDEALARLCEYLDNECTEIDFARLQAHFDHCGPCLSEYSLTVSVKQTLKRACDCEAAPVELRESIRLQISSWCTESR
ncbi:mycothiol system anti-sigma-R factor [Micrococcales bacterium 31B]|nr:mycothiol system anti-sigma-R factor [Micrococcales bacterium 31B]